MDIIELIPPKHLNFSLPNDTHRTLTITNLTLHSVYVGVIKSHQYEISLSNDWFFLQAFEQKKIEVTVNWNQQSRNCSMGKLRIFYFEIQQDANEQQLNRMLVTEKGKYFFEDLTVYVEIDFKAINFLYYKQSEHENVGLEAIYPEVNKKYYLMIKIKLPGYSQAQQKSLSKNQNLKNQILTYLQSLPDVVSIQTCQQTGYVIEFSQKKGDSCDFLSFETNQLILYYVSRRIIAYGTTQQMIPLVSLYDQQTHAHKQKKIQAHRKQKEIQKQQQAKSKQQQQMNQSEKKQIKKNHQSVKQSFAMRREGDKPKRRKNKSQQKIIENQFEDSDEDQEHLLRLQIQEMKKEALKGKKQQQTHKKQEAKQQQKIIKINQTNIQMCQKILNIYIDKKEDRTQVYVILRDCIRCYVLEEPMVKKVIKFDPIYEQNVSLPCPVDLYKSELIFGNQTSLFWVNLQNGQSQWKYVQRKYIYAVSVIEELSLVSVGGKNFSKLSYFGKETSRSNIKLYSCSSSDKHDHLFTYDLPGNNVGNVMNTAYITVPPLGTKLLLVHTLNSESIGAFHFLRVKAFNKIQVYGQIDLDQLGILHLVRFKYNPASQLVVCMQALGQTEMDSFKKLKVKCQYQKVEVFTQGLKVPLKKYHSFQLGGDKQAKQGEWMSIVDSNGTLCHIYHFQTNQIQTLQVGNGQIRQVYSLKNGRYMLVCAESFMRIRQNLQIKTGY